MSSSLSWIVSASFGGSSRSSTVGYRLIIYTSKCGTCQVSLPLTRLLFSLFFFFFFTSSYSSFFLLYQQYLCKCKSSLNGVLLRYAPSQKNLVSSFTLSFKVEGSRTALGDMLAFTCWIVIP